MMSFRFAEREVSAETDADVDESKAEAIPRLDMIAVLNQVFKDARAEEKTSAELLLCISMNFLE